MSLRLEMLQVARLAPKQLREGSRSVASFLRSQFNADGGARDRAGRSDLYYTAFAIDGLIALREEAPEPARTAGFLRSFGDGEGLDLVHLACLARCRSALGLAPRGARAESMAARLESFRSRDGGYAGQAGARKGTAYHAFLALGACQDLEVPPKSPRRLLESVDALRSRDGGYANRAGMSEGTTTATAAALALGRHLGRERPRGVDRWLLARAHPHGGFLATAKAPMPDLLSTATALHALRASPHPVREKCLDFLDTLWTGKAFCGHWGDDEEDAEYTFYALLALGHLSL